ncbi:MAG: RNA-binding transcriptional accessory protein, partial [Calditrichaeota bacterium]|nr:RNA-binding transcriptional accessory protein [Calditrichota bacterium]
IEVQEEVMLSEIQRRHITNRQSIFRSEIETAAADSYKRLIAPSIEREIRNELSERADDHAIHIFATNLKNLLMQPPVKDKIIMGIDPAYRTGCKVAVIDETGKYLEGATIFPHAPQNRVFEAKSALRHFIDKYQTEIIAIGNGTASRETEALVAELIGEIKQETPERELVYIIVNEAGASVYSASKVAKVEFPELEASQRGNISIARRLM